MGKFYYVVKEGRNPGIYSNWAECEKEVIGFKGAQYKKFKSKKEALDYLNIGEDELVDIEDNSINKEDKLDKKIKELGDKEIISYVDGSFDLNSFTYSYGVVLLTKDRKEAFNGRENNKKLAEMRNVAGELKGAMIAMTMALGQGMERLYLHYDYKGIEEWAKGNWKTNREGTKMYKRFYDSIREKLDVEFIKVLAHSGVKYNEEADRLAKEALN